MDTKLLNYAPVSTGNGSILPEELITSLQAQFKGRILRKEDEDYAQACIIWNRMIDKKPGIIAFCSGVADVIIAVQFAKKNNMLTAVRSGGHNVSGASMCNDGMVIDLSEMNAVWVDPQKKIAKVQGGALWADVDRETQAFGLMTPGGVVSNTGVAGLTLSGGLSWTRRKYGLTIDNMIAADVVTPDGQLLTASPTENPDLFWGLKGGGGNFGIVTSFEFQLHELGPEVMFAATMYPIEESEKVLDFWLDFMKAAPNEITVDLAFWSIPAHPAFPEHLHHRRVINLFSVYAGDASIGEKALQPLRDITTPVLDMSNRMPYTNVQAAFDWVNPKGEQLHYWKSLYVNEFTEDLKKIIIEKSSNRPVDSILVFIRPFGGAVNKIDTKDSAFGKRENFLISIDATWMDESDSEECIDWVRSYWNEILPFSKGQTYFGFAGDMEETQALVEDAFSSNHHRLVKIKTKYDPDNFFSINQNIKPAVAK